MTLQEIERSDKVVLTPAEVAEVVRCDPHYIRLQARDNPKLLGFPVIVTGNCTKIPREALLRFLKGGPPCEST